MTDPQHDPSNPSDTQEPEKPRRLVMARPVTPASPNTGHASPSHSADDVSSAPQPFLYARALPVSPIHLDMIWWKALLQIMALVPFLVGGMIAGVFTAYALGHAEDAWFNVITSSGMGLGGLIYVLMQLHLTDTPARTIGWTFRHGTENAAVGVAALIMFYCVAFVIAFAIMMLIAQHNPDILTAEPESARAIKETFPQMSLPVVILMMTFVAVWEEVVFRGFLLTRLRAMVKHWWLAVVLGAVLFSFGHVYQGLLGMFLTFVLGLVLGALFVWRKSLVPGITYHICQNVLAYQLTQWFYMTQ